MIYSLILRGCATTWIQARSRAEVHGAFSTRWWCRWWWSGPGRCSSAPNSLYRRGGTMGVGCKVCPSFRAQNHDTRCVLSKLYRILAGAVVAPSKSRPSGVLVLLPPHMRSHHTRPQSPPVDFLVYNQTRIQTQKTQHRRIRRDLSAEYLRLISVIPPSGSLQLALPGTPHRTANRA